MKLKEAQESLSLDKAELTDGKKMPCKCLLVGSLTLCTSLLPLELKVMLAQIKSKTGLLHLCAHTAGPNLVSIMQSIFSVALDLHLSFLPPSTDTRCSGTCTYLPTRGSNRTHQWGVDLGHVQKGLCVFYHSNNSNNLSTSSSFLEMLL